MTTAMHDPAGDAPLPDAGTVPMGSTVSTGRKALVALATIMLLAAGIFVAAHYGDFTMRAHGGNAMPMNMPMK